jgi:hypothetical protein
MKPSMNTLLPYISILLVMAVGTNAFSQVLPDNAQQETNTVEKKYFDNGFMKYELSGNDNIDAQRYADAKLKLKEDYPGEYQKMVEVEQAKGKHIIDADELEKMPKEKREHILDNPDKYEIKRRDG